MAIEDPNIDPSKKSDVVDDEMFQNFENMIKDYKTVEGKITESLKSIQGKDDLSPGDYLKVQMEMSRLSQIVESISQYIQVVQSTLASVLQKLRPR